MIRGDTELRVLYALAPGRVGGLETVVTALARGLGAAGHQIHVAAVVEPESEKHPFFERIAAEHVSAERLEVPHRAYPLEVRQLRAALSRFSPDLVHTHGYRADVLAGIVARRSGFPVVSTVHGFTGGGWKNRLYEWLQLRSLRKFEAVVAVSEPMVGDLVASGVSATRVHRVPNAIVPASELLPREAARRRLGLSDEEPTIGWVGRMSKEKGPDVLLRAAGLLDERAWTFSFVGDGPEAGHLRYLAEKLDVDARLRFHGEVPGAAELYRAFDVFVLSSRSEGTPMSLLEAMAAEVPVVATRVGGVPDVVRHEREALLVPPDDPEALAAAIERVRSEPEEARQRAVRARERLEDTYDVETWLNRYEAVYRHAIERHAEGANA